jgi:NAD/NADP transhydrogenase beta subunit
MSNQQTGLLIIAIGVGVVLLGAIVWLGGLAWFGKLPGDIRIQGQSGTVFIPITSMIVISVVLSVGLNLLMRFLRWLS